METASILVGADSTGQRLDEIVRSIDQIEDQTRQFLDHAFWESGFPDFDRDDGRISPGGRVPLHHVEDGGAVLTRDSIKIALLTVVDMNYL
jgi:hypothetical protein